jgi:hypothetical protein
MADVALLVLQLALQIAVPYWIVRRDMRRLPPQLLARTWNDASCWAAVVTFGLLCVPVHFIKSRRTLHGALLGLLWMAAASALALLPGLVVESLAAP